MAEYPDLIVETEAHRLFSAEKGQLVVFVPNIDEAETLNFNRTLLSELELRVVLYCDEATSGRLAQTAPDFFHWISHWIEGPSGPAPEMVARLQTAARAYSIPIEWIGGLQDLESAFAVALPGMDIEVVSAKKALAALAVSARHRPKTWILWTDVDHERDLGRLLLAWHDAGRGGRNLFLSAGGPLSLPEDAAVTRVDARRIGFAEAIVRLKGQGATNPGRLAAFAELSRASIEKIERLSSAGYSISKIEDRLAQSARPWAVLDELLHIRPEPDEKSAERAREASDDAALALGLLEHARILEQQGNFAEAEPLVREGLGLYEELFGINDARTRQATRQLTHLLKARGRYGEAIEAWLRVLPAPSSKEARSGPRYPESHWLHAEDVKAADDLLFLVSQLRHRGLAERALEAVRQALGDEARVSQSLAEWVARLPAE